MKIGELIKEIGDDALTKDHIYHWEKIGLIKPKIIKKAKIDRKEYSERDLEIIGLIWKYRKEGFPPKIAYKKGLEEENNRKDVKGILSRAQVFFSSFEPFYDGYKQDRDFGKINRLAFFPEVENRTKKKRRENIYFHLKFPSEQLYKLSSIFLKVIQREFPDANTLLGISDHASILVGAIAAIAFDKKALPLLALNTDQIYLESQIDANAKIVLVDDIVFSTNILYNLVNRIEKAKARILGSISIIELIKEKEKNKIGKTPIKIVSIFNTKGDFLPRMREILATQ